MKKETLIVFTCLLFSFYSHAQTQQELNEKSGAIFDSLKIGKATIYMAPAASSKKGVIIETGEYVYQCDTLALKVYNAFIRGNATQFEYIMIYKSRTGNRSPTVVRYSLNEKLFAVEEDKKARQRL